jgi:CcmD family protein
MRSYDFLFWGTAVVWAGIVAYQAFLGIRLRRVRGRLERLERTAMKASQKETS